MTESQQRFSHREVGENVNISTSIRGNILSTNTNPSINTGINESKHIYK